MAVLNAPENTPVWVDEARCKACDKCVDACPAGVLAMRQAPEITWFMITVVHPEAALVAVSVS